MAELVKIESSHIYDLSYALIGAYGRSPWNEVWTVAQARECIVHTATQSDSIGYALVEDGVAIGAVIGKVQRYRDLEFFINQLFVHPDYQGKGFGKRLLRHLEEELRKLGITHISLTSIGADRSFYEACGYTVTDWLCIIRET